MGYRTDGLDSTPMLASHDRQKLESKAVNAVTEMNHLIELLTKRLGTSEVNHILTPHLHELRLIGEVYGILLS